MYVLLQLIEKLFFKSSNVKIKKIFKIKIKKYIREILFRIYNQFIDFLHFIEFCDKINQNYYYYQRNRSKYLNFILFFIKQNFFFRFRFDLSKKFQKNFNDVKTTKFVLNVIYQIIN